MTGLGWRAVLQQRLARVRRRTLFVALRDCVTEPNDTSWASKLSSSFAKSAG
jgi:hypothetical protein